MSNLLTGIAPQAGLIAQSSSQTAAQGARNVAGNAAQAQVVQRAIASGTASSPAAVVTLSGQGKTRAASYGEGRSVDASFEKSETAGKGTSPKDGEGDAKQKSTLSVTA